MADQIIASGTPGSADGSVPANNSAGQTNTGVDWEKQYKELESKFGSQGKELGEYREFVQGLTPLFEKLDASPELVQAIVDGKIDGNYAKAALEGKLSIAQAQAATAAQAEVQSELSASGAKVATPEEIARLVEEKFAAKSRELEERDEYREFERKTNEFIERTSDFADYADAIDKWIDEHDVTDIEVAYYAVKGKLSEESARKAAEEAAAEEAKQIILNAGPGGVTAQGLADGKSLADQLIGGRVNPNLL